jgi:hypothetical protein
MTVTEWCAVGTFAIAAVILLLQLGRKSAGWDRGGGDGSPTLGELDRQMKELAARMDKAGEQSSVLAIFVNGIETRMRDIFMEREWCDERHEALHTEIQLLRTHGRDRTEP